MGMLIRYDRGKNLEEIVDGIISGGKTCMKIVEVID